MFASFNEPEWRNRDPKVRKKAVMLLKNKEKLEHVIKHDIDPEIRKKAVEILLAIKN